MPRYTSLYVWWLSHWKLELLPHGCMPQCTSPIAVGELWSWIMLTFDSKKMITSSSLPFRHLFQILWWPKMCFVRLQWLTKFYSDHLSQSRFEDNTSRCSSDIVHTNMGQTAIWKHHASSRSYRQHWAIINPEKSEGKCGKSWNADHKP